MSKRFLPHAMRTFFVIFLCLCQLNVGWNQQRLEAADANLAFRTVPGFEVELVHDVSAADQGSWVSLCIDPKGRIIASDQYGKLYRVTVDSAGKASVEQLQVNIGLAQGMLCAFDSLYININANSRERAGTDAQGPGVYRLTDTTGDDQYDRIEYIVPMTDKAGEHGPHALVLSPDGKQIYFCSGNQVDVPESVGSSLVPRHWDEDHLLGRLADAGGHMAGRLAPGGWICRMDPDGSNVQLIATGFRNEYDMAFNAVGDLFAYDADMEWDIGSPWYRPTRVNHVIGGAEFGWRNGTGKWPAYYGDSFGSVVDIGPGSPTGVAFGTGAKFPAKYQNALYISDWSYGVIYAVHMTPAGASYTGEFEPFVTAAPMAVTDLVIHPEEGTMYFAVGGRRTASALYRVRYTGSDSTATAEYTDPAEAQTARLHRRELESAYLHPTDQAIKQAVADLGHPDRAIRFTARIALEHQPVAEWRESALAQTKPLAMFNAAMALARCGAKDAQAEIHSKLVGIDFSSLSELEQLNLLRAHNLLWMRLAPPTAEQRAQVLSQLDAKFPASSTYVNRELAATLIYLRAPNIAARVVHQMHVAGAQDEQIHYAFCLRELNEGWDAKSRHDYFQWFHDVASARGGRSFVGFLKNIRQVALDSLSSAERQALGDLAGPMPEPRDPLEDLTPRQFVKNWTLEDLQAELAKLQVEPDFDKGQRLTATAQCFKCHRFAGKGGIQAPDLTATSGRFNQTDMITAIVDPNKEISDQYQATSFLTEDGDVITGRVANLSGKNIQVVTNMLAPGDFTGINVDSIVERRPSPLSMMPAGLLNTFSAEEIAQILSYLKSGGDPGHALYQ
ncbi:MAG: c-type cytochrome [Planctomycetales bacterium]|nr:c-type cytochrome [Planctomycetales bacterium]